MDPYKKMGNKVKTVILSFQTKWSVLGVWGVWKSRKYSYCCSVAKCKYPFCGLYYKRVTIVIDTPSVVKVTLQIVASLTIVIDDAS